MSIPSCTGTTNHAYKKRNIKHNARKGPIKQFQTDLDNFKSISLRNVPFISTWFFNVLHNDSTFKIIGQISIPYKGFTCIKKDGKRRHKFIVTIKPTNRI